MPDQEQGCYYLAPVAPGLGASLGLQGRTESPVKCALPPLPGVPSACILSCAVPTGLTFLSLGFLGHSA